MGRLAINEKIEATLESLDGIKRATPAPYLLTRIRARLQQESRQSFWSRAGSFLSRPAVAGIGMALFITANLLAVSSITSRNASSAVATQITTNTKYEFAINVTSMYDIENQEP